MLCAAHRHYALLAVVLTAGCLLRLPGLLTPITGVRDSQTASITRNLLRDGPGGLLYPRVNYPGDAPGYLALEFPIFNAVAALFATGLPVPEEAAFRLPSILAYLVEALCLFDLARRRISVRGAHFAVLLLSLFPIHMQMSVTHAPDEASVALAVASAAMLDRFCASGRDSLLLGAALAVGLSALLKAPNLIILFPLAGILVTRRGPGSLLSPRTIGALLIAIVPFALWTIHSLSVNATSELWHPRTALEAVEEYAAQRGRVDLYSSSWWYKAIGALLLRAYNVVAIALAAVGLVVMMATRSSMALPALLWGLGLIVYCLLLPFSVISDYNYSLPFAPLLALLGGSALGYLTCVPLGRLGTRAGWLAGFVLIALIASLELPDTMSRQRRHDPIAVEFGQLARRVTPPGSRLVVSDPRYGPWNASALFQADRRGWIYAAFPPRSRVEQEDDRVLSIERLEWARARGATFLGHLGDLKTWQEARPDLYKHIYKTYRVVASTRNGFIVDLQPKSASEETSDTQQ